MSDKLGVGGTAHYHAETLDATYESTREGRRANSIAILALVVACLSAAPAWLSYQNSSSDLRQNRESLLLQDRIETCANVDSVAYSLVLEAGTQRTFFADRRSTPLERNEATSRILEKNVELISVSRLTYYGPSDLMLAESDVGAAAVVVLNLFGDAAMDRVPWNDDALTAALATLTQKREAREACARAQLVPTAMVPRTRTEPTCKNCCNGLSSFSVASD